MFLISSNFIVFSFSAVAGLFSFFTEAPADENKRDGEKDRTESKGGWPFSHGSGGHSGSCAAYTRKMRSERRNEATNRDGDLLIRCAQTVDGKVLGGLLVPRKEKINSALKRLEHLSFMC
jgi:hypothetical protein